MDDIRKNIIGGVIGGLAILAAFSYLGTAAGIVAIVVFLCVLVCLPWLWRRTKAILGSAWAGAQRAVTADARRQLDDLSTSVRSLETIVRSMQRRSSGQAGQSEEKRGRN